MRRDVLLPIAFLVLLSFLVTYPLPFRFRTWIPGDLGDPLLYVWTLEWNWARLRDGLRNYFDAPMFYPYEGTLTYSEHLLGHAPLYGIARLLTGRPVAAYDFVFWTTFVLSGVGAFVLVRSLTGNAWAGLLAGTIFMTAPWRFGQIFHLHVLSTHWLPWIFWLAHRWSRRPSWPQTVGLTVLILLQCWSSLTYGAFLFLFGLVFGLLFFRKSSVRPPWTQWACLGLGTFVGLFPFYRAYERVYDLMGFTRTKQENIYFSADVLSFLCAPSFNRLYGPWTQKLCKAEGLLFPGWVATTLAGAAVVTLGRVSRPDRPALRVTQRVLLIGGLALALLEMAHASLPSDWSFEFFVQWDPRLQRLMELLFGTCFLLFWVVLLVRKRSVLETPEGRTGAFYAFMLVAAVVLALGPVIHFGGRRLGWGPYVWLFRYVPGFQAMRVPARVMAYGMLAIAVLAGWAVRRWRYPRLWGPVLTALVVVEGWSVPLPMERVPSMDEVPAVYRWLQQAAVPGAPIVEVPVGRDHTRLKYTELRYLYFQTFHGHPMVNGLSGFFPETSYTLQELLHSGHYSTWIRALAFIGVRYVVLHTEAVEPAVVEALRRQPRVRSVATFGNDVVLALEDARPLRDSDWPPGALTLRLPRWTSPGASIVAAVEFPDDRFFLFRPPRNRVPVRVEFQEATSGRVLRVESVTLTLPHLVTPFHRFVSFRLTAPAAVGLYRVRVRQPSGDPVAESPIEVRAVPPVPTVTVLQAEYLGVELPTGYTEYAFVKGGLGRAHIRNAGNAVWYSTWDARPGRTPYGVWVRWRLFSRWGEFLGEGKSTLPFDVSPGDGVEIVFRVDKFADAGPYALSLEVVSDESAPVQVQNHAWVIDRWDVRQEYRERPP